MVKCARNDCNEQGTAHPVLLLSPTDHPEATPAEFIIGMWVCPKHQENAKASDFVSDDGWEHIEHVFASISRVLPDRATVGLVFKRDTPYDHMKPKES